MVSRPRALLAKRYSHLLHSLVVVVNLTLVVHLIPPPLFRAGLKPIPEKPQRAKMVTMGTKRVLDESVFSDHDDAGGDDDDGSKANSNGTRDALRGDEPIDVFNPVRTYTHNNAKIEKKKGAYGPEQRNSM